MQSSLSDFQKVDDAQPVVEKCETSGVAIKFTSESPEEKKEEPADIIKINVKTLTGKKITVEVRANERVEVFKAKIQEKEDLAPQKQKLLYSGKHLEDGRRLNDYNISNGANVHLVRRADDDMRIAIKFLRVEDTLSLEVEANDTILKVKQKIQQRKNIEPEDQNLFFSGKRLEDERTLADYSIQNDVTLLLSRKSGGQQKPEPKPEPIDPSGFYVTVFYMQNNLKVRVEPNTTMKKFYEKIVEMTKDPIVFLFGGRILPIDDSTVTSYNISKDENVFAIPEWNGGNCLRFMQILQDAADKDQTRLIESLSSVVNKGQLTRFFEEATPSLSSVPIFKQYPPLELLAVKLWTSNLVHAQVNQQLAKTEDLSIWSSYLKILMKGLKHLQYYRGTVYKGVKGKCDLSMYKVGAKVNWKTIAGLSKARDKAKNNAGTDGTIFEVDVVSAKDVAKLSVSPSEDILLLPYSCFEVTEINVDQPVVIKLREIPIPRAPKVIFWVDDNPEYNFHYASPIEEKDISCVFCTNTKDALSVIENYKWLLHFDDSDFRIVTDMVRYEAGKPNYSAGIDLLKALFNEFKYKYEVLVFCNDTQRAEDSIAQSGVKEGGKYVVTNLEDKLNTFINYASKAEKK